MQLDRIRKQIAELISTDIDVWNDVLNNTTPGNYGCDYWEAEISFNDIFANIPERTFTVKNGKFTADLIMGSSNSESSFNESYSKPFSAKGKFDFKNSDELMIEEIEIDIDSDIYGED